MRKQHQRLSDRTKQYNTAHFGAPLTRLSFSFAILLRLHGT